MGPAPSTTSEAPGVLAPLSTPPAPSPISFSRISTWAACGEKFRLKYVASVEEEPQGALIGGRAIHSTIEQAERLGIPGNPQDSDVDELTTLFTGFFSEQLEEAGENRVRWSGRASTNYPNKEDKQWWLDKAPEMLRNYLYVRAADFDAGAVLPSERIETKVLTLLDSGTPLQGYLDAFVIDLDGQQVIRDWKTGRPGGSNPMQLATYAWAWERTTGSLPTVGEFIYLRTADPAKRAVRVNLEPLIPLVPSMLAMFEKAHSAGIYHINPGSFCSSCTVRTHCAYGATL